MFDKELLSQAIVEYKNQFEKWWPDERFKWEAVKYFQENWDIESPDFSEMLTRTLDKQNVYYSLLASSKRFPVRTLINFSKHEPETVRTMFSDLFDEEKDVFERITTFKNTSELLRQKYFPNDNQHFQDENSISTYLWLKYPDKYYIYKFSEVKAVATILNSDYTFKKGAYETNLRYSISFYDEICEELSKDAELVSMLENAIDATCYSDLQLRTLAIDIGFFMSRVIANPDKNKEEAFYAGWWPSLEEYNPNLSKDDWKKYILEVEKPNHPLPMKMLKGMMELGGEASCKKLAAVYGGTPSSYVGSTMNLGRRVKKYFDLPACMDGEQERYFPFPFLGKAFDDKDGHQYIYKIRPELFEALKEIDLSDISPYYDEGDDNEMNTTDIALNTILYGPPGTGKTYNTVCYAVAIIENKPLEDIMSEAADEGGYAEVFRRYNEHKDSGRIAFSTFHQSYGYEEFIEGIKPVMDSAGNGDIKYAVVNGVFKDFCEQEETLVPVNRVFIIDEINRGNISKIFGELITLIEPSKRIGAKEGIKAILPYSKKAFGIPDNVYILGTMNTADRSIATLDTALRRRFDFVEMMPDENVLEGIEVDGINISRMLGKINERISVLFDREHTIGHAYFIGLKDDNSIEALSNIFRNKVIPLLQEYFYEDYEKIRLILADNQVQDEDKQFVIANEVKINYLFGTNDIELIDDSISYKMNPTAFENKEAYIKIYSK